LRNGLIKYRAFRQAVDELRTETDTLEGFSEMLRHDDRLKKLRNEARAELQLLYDDLRQHFGLGPLSVYFPVRKKIYEAGRAVQEHGSSTEIRIYSIKGCSAKPYNSWAPADVGCYSEAEVFETFIHEVAHVLESSRHGKMTHGKSFIGSYEEIEAYFKARGFGGLIDPAIRLTGVPRKRKRG
jgi:hypothetical protein